VFVLILTRDVEAAISSTTSTSANKKWENDRWPWQYELCHGC